MIAGVENTRRVTYVNILYYKDTVGPEPLMTILYCIYDDDRNKIHKDDNLADRQNFRSFDKLPFFFFCLFFNYMPMSDYELIFNYKFL